MNLLKSVSTYTLLNLLNSGIPVLLLPVLTVYLTPKDFGVLSNFNSLFLVLVPFIGLNIGAAISRQYYNKETNLPEYIGNSVVLLLINFLIIQLLITLTARIIEQYTKVPVLVVYSVALYSLLHNLIELLLSIWRLENKPFWFGVFRILRTAAEITMSLTLVIVFKYGWTGRLMGIYTTTVIAALCAVFILFKKGLVKFKLNKVYLNHFVKFGLPLIPHSVSGIIMLYSDKIFITNLIGISESGIYSTAYQIGMVISLIQNSFNQAWVPWLYGRLSLNEDGEKRKLVKITYIFFGFMLLTVVVLWMAVPLIFSLIGKDFASGAVYVVWIGLGFAFNGMYKMVVNYIFYAEKTHIIMFSTFAVAIINIILNLILIKHYGVLGSAIATTLTFFIEFVVTWIISNWLYPMPWTLRTKV